MATTYFGTKPVSDWTANGPAEGGHNFIDQINEQKGKISGLEEKYNTAYGNIEGAQNAYDEAYKGQKSYSDLYKQAKGEEGVDDARAQYQKSLASVNATNTAMRNLPSTINAGSNVVLNASQRNAALGNQMNKYQNTLGYWTDQNAGDLNQYQTALGAAQNLAGQNMSQEQTFVNQAMTNLQTQMNMANELYDKVLQERQIMRSIYGDMFEDEYKHRQQEIEIWAQNLEAENKRLAEEQETARNNARIAAERYAADAGLRLQQYLQQQEEAKQARLNQPTIQSYISSTGNYYDPRIGTGTVEPVVTYKDNGKTKVNNYVASPEMLAQLMYGGN